MGDGGGQQERPRAGRAITWPPRERAATPVAADRVGWRSLAESNLRWLRAEAGPGRLLPWVPVAFGAGIALYFAAPREPVASVAILTAAVFCVIAFLARRRRAFPAVLMAAALAAGFATAALKAARVAHEVLARPLPSVALKGFVETREERERTDRFVLRVEEMTAPGEAPKLARVRLSVRKGTAPAVGSFVALKARLLPPLAPLRPGGYDFGRDMYFAGLGASGFVMGAVATLEPPRSGGVFLRYAAAMQGMRDAIDARIRTVLGGDARAIATALLTGRRDAISTPVNDALFVSGLGHVLSISGYHMAIVAGAVFFAVRALLALFPPLTVTFPIKKWSAAAALAAAAFYLLLSGAEVATQRSFLMTAVVLVAVMVDRRAITFRTLAIAALVVLVVAPESLVYPSFQMSFAATLGLVALVQGGMPHLFAAPDNSKVARAALWGGRELVMLLLASLVAGLATLPYAAFHFHRVAPYGVIANLAAMPVVSLLVMPAGLVGLLAMPFGFDGVFWRLMDLGIGWMVAVAQWVAALPGAAGSMAAFGTGPLLAMSAGIVVLGLLRTPLRWIGGGIVAVAMLAALAAPQPDILVAGDGRAVAVRGNDGRLRLMRSGQDAFQAQTWLAADADPRASSDASLSEGVSCDAGGCVVQAADGRLVALALQPEAFTDDCTRAAVIVTTRQKPADCAAQVFDQETLRGQGALALSRSGDGYAVTATRPPGTDRPWARGVAEKTGESETTRRRSSRPARVIDATPTEADLQADD
jgi:competence protein ComEC